MDIYHKHHIIPKHMGGTDDPSNLVSITVEEHAEAHKVLWENHGKTEDLLAWMGLSKIINQKQILKTLNEEKRGKIWITDGKVQKLVSPSALNDSNYQGFHKGRLPMSEQGKANIAASSPKKRKPLTEAHKANISKGRIGKRSLKTSPTGPRKVEYKTPGYSYEKYLKKKGRISPTLQ